MSVAPRTMKSPVARPATALRDPAPRLVDQGAFRSSFVAWGYFNIFLTAIWSFVPYGDARLPTGQIFELGFMMAFLSESMYLAVGIFALKLPLRAGWCVSLCLLMQAWLAFTTLYMGESIGRMAAIGSLNIWPLTLAIGFLAYSMHVYVWPKSREVVENVVISLFTLSAIFGVLQFVKFAPAYKVILHPEGIAGADYKEGGLRAVGLAYFPTTAAIQGFVGSAILVGRLRVRAWKIWEIVAFTLLFAFFVVAQFRTLYIMAPPLAFVAFGLYWRHSKLIPFVALTICIALAAALIVVFPKRFEYVLNPQKYKESANIRQGKSYVQVQPIFQSFPMTGLGSDTALTLGFADPETGSDKWSDFIIDSSVFLTLATAGIPGLTLLLMLVFSVLGWLVGETYRARSQIERSSKLITALLCSLMYVINICVNNGMVYPHVRWSIVLVIALAMPTLEESRRTLARPFASRFRRVLEARAA